MRKLVVFNSTSLDGYFTDASGDMRFAYNPQQDEEFNAFTASNASARWAWPIGRTNAAE